LLATAPQYLSELFRLVADVASGRHLRSDCVNKLIVPRHKMSSVGWHAFSVAGLSVWNSLADYLRDSALGLNSFRRQLKRLVCTQVGTSYRARERYYDYALYKFAI